MNTRSSGIRGSLLVALVVGLLAVPEADAKGSRGGRSGGRAARAPRVSAPRRVYKAPAYKAPRMPRAAAPARANAARSNNSQARANRAAVAATRRANTGTVNPATTARTNHAATTGTVPPTRSVLGNPTGTTTHRASPSTSGSGTGARPYRAYGSGSGHRNRYSGRRSGYGRSQGSNRAIVARLRSVHASLARIDRDYQGHRLRAMHGIAMAIRQLTHRSMVDRGVGFAPGGNNGPAMGMRRSVLGPGARRTQVLTQAQSDARMSQALRTLQGINMQLSSQGYSTTGHARARGHVKRAVHELNTALSIR